MLNKAHFATFAVAFGMHSALALAQWSVSFDSDSFATIPGGAIVVSGRILNDTGAPLQIESVSTGSGTAQVRRFVRVEVAPQFAATGLLIPTTGYAGPLVLATVSADAPLCLSAECGAFFTATSGTTPLLSASTFRLLVQDAVEPHIISNPPDVRVRTGRFTSMTVQAVSDGPLTYQWQRDGGDIIDGYGLYGARSSTLSIDSRSQYVQSSFRVLVTNACGSVASRAARVTVLSGCHADVDDGTGTGVPDGGVTTDDLLYFLSQYATGARNADIDDGSGTGTPDGGVTIDDLLYFLLRFESGC